MANSDIVVESAPKTKRVNPVSAWVDKVFHVSERGGTIASEIGSGIASALIASCALIVNTRLIGSSYGNNAGAYLAATILSLLGTLLLGIIFNRPVIQISNLVISASVVSMLGTYEGLTYSNIMMITFFSALIYLGIVVSPLGKSIVSILPSGVKKALPIGVGLFTIIVAFKNSGILSSVGSLTTTASLTGMKKYILFLLFLGIALYVVLKVFKEKKASFRIWGVLLGLMWVGGILFFMSTFIGGQTAAVVVYERLNVFFATDGAQPYNIGLGFASIHWGSLFTSGFDFSAVKAAGGNPGLIIIQGLLTFIALGMYSNVANLHATAASGDFLLEDGSVENERKAYLITASLNVVAPLIGMTPTSIGSESGIATDNEAKTGLSSVVASLGFLIGMFSWVIFALTATSTNGVGMWIESSETKLAAYVNDVFAFSDLVMIFVGASMLKGFKTLDYKDAGEMIPFVITLIALLVSGNYALAVSLGVLSNALVNLVAKKWDAFKIPNLVLDGALLVYVIFALI
jgi:AGZA family xanthine/uracil permease-like MFS transporter